MGVSGQVNGLMVAWFRDSLNGAKGKVYRMFIVFCDGARGNWSPSR